MLVVVQNVVCHAHIFLGAGVHAQADIRPRQFSATAECAQHHELVQGTETQAAPRADQGSWPKCSDYRLDVMSNVHFTQNTNLSIFEFF